MGQLAHRWGFKLRDKEGLDQRKNRVGTFQAYAEVRTHDCAVLLPLFAHFTLIEGLSAYLLMSPPHWELSLSRSPQSSCSTPGAHQGKTLHRAVSVLLEKAALHGVQEKDGATMAELPQANGERRNKSSVSNIAQRIF
jgi:hypothetical protein